jgi:uncharacterized protein (UPF0548 family)
MKREWRVCRAVVEVPDGQRRWDYAYQFLLRWMMEQTAEQQPRQENEHENRPICTSINQSPDAKPKH